MDVKLDGEGCLFIPLFGVNRGERNYLVFFVAGSGQGCLLRSQQERARDGVKERVKECRREGRMIVSLWE
jgi:hypothetical protein